MSKRQPPLNKEEIQEVFDKFPAMTDFEIIAAIEALGWYGLTFRADRIVGYHATRPKGWQEVHAPAPGRNAVLASFLQNIQNPEILAQYP